MKKSLFLFTSILLVFVARAQTPMGLSGSEDCSLKKSQGHSLPKLPGKADTGRFSHDFDILDYTLDLDIFHCFSAPWPNDFTGSNTVTFLAGSTLSEIKLNAVSNSIQILEVGINGSSFTHTGDTLTIQLDRIYQPGETAKVKISYKHLNVKDNAFNVGYNMVFTDAEPEGARKWFPCFDHPSDKATLDLTVKVPVNVKLGSNGALVDSIVNGDTLVYHWQSIHPVATYLVAITSGSFYNLDILLWPKPGNPSVSVPFRFYYYPGADPSPVENVIREMCTYYSENFCEHPFQKNGFAEVDSLFLHGGMENQTLTTIRRLGWNEPLAAHEFAHQWFGDMITCGTWADIWLNEGFATWCESFWKQHTQGDSAYMASLTSNADYYLANNPGWAMVVPSWANRTPSQDTLFNYSITYAKGACFLHQLRYMLGDSLFIRCLKAFCADTSLRFRSAVTADLNSTVNQVTGSNFDWYFNTWLFQPNHPVYENYYYFRDLNSGLWEVDFLANQTQTDAPFFPMLLEVRIRFADNTDTVFRIMNGHNYQAWNWTFFRQPVAFQFDPDGQILLKHATTYPASTNVFPDALVLKQAVNSYDTILLQACSRWTIQGTMPGWLTADKLSGFANEFVAFHSLSANPDTISRTAYLTMVPDLAPSIGFTVTQLGIPGGVDEKDPARIRVFPNPARNEITVSFEMIKPASISITLTDLAGRMVLKPVNDLKKAGEYSLNLDCSSVASGVYFITVMTEDFKVTRKVIISK